MHQPYNSPGIKRYASVSSASLHDIASTGIIYRKNTAPISASTIVIAFNHREISFCCINTSPFSDSFFNSAFKFLTAKMLNPNLLLPAFYYTHIFYFCNMFLSYINKVLLQNNICTFSSFFVRTNKIPYKQPDATCHLFFCL